VPAPFLPQEYAGRVAAARTAMRERGIGTLCLAGPENIYYLTGLDHQGHFAFTMLVVPPDGPLTIVARAMERPTLAAQVPEVRHVPFDDGADPGVTAARAVAEAAGDGAVAVEKASMNLPVAVWESLRAGLRALDVVDGSGLVDALRAVKSPAEIEQVRRAAAVSDAAMQAGIGAVRTGANEQDVVAAAYQAMLLGGGQIPGIPPLVRSRDLLLQEHVTWRDHVVGDGDAVFLELSGAVARYHAPLTRMVYLGAPPAGTDAAAAIALDGLSAVRDALRPGALARDVYAAWQQVVDAGLGHSRYRRHHCGYLTGIGFPPSWVGGSAVVGLRHDSDLVVQAGMVCHVLSWLLGQEPADYVVSDTVLVTPTGGELLTTTARDPITAA
jgi:Xaa-Pro dipeptidase